MLMFGQQRDGSLTKYKQLWMLLLREYDITQLIRHVLITRDNNLKTVVISGFILWGLR